MNQIKDKTLNQEQIRLEERKSQKKDWAKWGPYLSERQWGTVREDYSEYGNAWDYFPHDHARSRAYRWGEDGIAGISDEFQNICFSVALWNGKDPILKERLFGLNGNEGNHGEDCKELYYYLDNTPSHAYMKYLYKYTQNEYPYDDLLHTNTQRSRQEPEYELLDTQAFQDSKYFDVFIEYAKEDTEDILIKITACNRGSEEAEISLLPTLWFRNEWSFGLTNQKPTIQLINDTPNSFGGVKASHAQIGDYYLYFENADKTLFTENETNNEKLFGFENPHPFVKDAFHRAVIENDYEFLEGKTDGTKFSPLYTRTVPAGEEVTVKLRFSKKPFAKNPLAKSFDTTFSNRLAEADEFYKRLIPENGDADLASIQRQAFAGMLWTKQFYYLDVEQWLNGDPGQPEPPYGRKFGRNTRWMYLNNADIISMPDKWEYPWYAVWDLAFHCVPIAMIDPEFAKNQLILITREWYMAPNGQIPAYEWAFDDVNPPVHAWAALKVFQIEREMTGNEDINFLKRIFQKLLINFTWWVNRKDADGNNVFEGGFLGLDNIGVFDRSNMPEIEGALEQADATSWMGMYALNMMNIALEIARYDSSFEDIATKFFEHFAYIAEAINNFVNATWDEETGFFYDVLHQPNQPTIPIKVKSLVGLSALFATTVIRKELLEHVPDFTRRMEWFRTYRCERNKYLVIEEYKEGDDILISLVAKDRLERLLTRMLDESEFLAPGGIRALSRWHKDNYYAVHINGQEYGITYEPAESTTSLFGGNSNWRGPIWMPMNYLLVESIREYFKYFGDDFKVEYPQGSGDMKNLDEVADGLSRRLISMFQKDDSGSRPINGEQGIYQDDPHFQDLVLFYEYFHGDNSRGVGASHQTGWTGVVAELINRCGWNA